MFVDVALKIRSEKVLTYSVPDNLASAVALGKRVLVPLGNRKIVGCILAVAESRDIKNPRAILDVLDPEPLFSGADLEFYRWAADYYFYPEGKLVSEIIPGSDSVKSEKFVSLTGLELDESLLNPEQLKLINLIKAQRSLPLNKLKTSGLKHMKETLEGLEQAGAIEIREKVKVSAVRQKTEKLVQLAGNGAGDTELSPREKKAVDFLSEHGPKSMSALRKQFGNIAALVRRLERKNIIRISEAELIRMPASHEFHESPCPVSRLSGEQDAALTEIKAALSRGVFSPFLLHGVTGSGKTEVYLGAMEEALKGGGNAIYLVPEISLTPQLLARVRERFPAVPISVLHSSIPEAVRFDQWRLVSRGETRIVVGARSAVFAPVPRLKLIIVDEEHDPSYKQEDRMRYNGRDLAILKARQNSAVVVLGSATPGVQSFRAARSGRLTYLSLTRRIGDRPFPEMQLVDMRKEREERGRATALSSALKTALGETLESGAQSLVFLNRRGFNTFIQCRNCGHAMKCRNCSVSLVLHASENSLKCHYCDYAQKVPAECPQCGAAEMARSGTGTERLEREISELFPAARVARMDRDTASGRGAHAKILNSLSRGEIDILVGTQMISKGHDYPNIHLVGVVSVDNTLNMPDFRAAERCFQLLTQVSGRGGRGDVPGRVIVQTYNPTHYAIRRAMENDFPAFYEEESRLRRELAYPPFSRIVSLEVTSLNRDRAKQGAEMLAGAARGLGGKKTTGVTALGPVEAPVNKIKNRYRWKMLLKGANVKSLHGAVKGILSAVPEKGFEIRIDVDPVNFL